MGSAWDNFEMSLLFKFNNYFLENKLWIHHKKSHGVYLFGKMCNYYDFLRNLKKKIN